MLIMRMSVESDSLGSVLLLRCLQLREHLAVRADFLSLQLLGVRDVREQLTDVIELPAESVDIVAQIRRVVIVCLVFHGLDDRPDLTDPAMQVFQLRVDLALDDFQIRDHDTDPHHQEGGDRSGEIRTKEVSNRRW